VHDQVPTLKPDVPANVTVKEALVKFNVVAVSSELRVKVIDPGIVTVAKLTGLVFNVDEPSIVNVELVVVTPDEPTSVQPEI
jgi:hypothetical protein